MITKTLPALALATALVIGSASARAADSQTSLGGGVHYNRYVDDIDTDDIEEEAYSYLIALRHNASYLLGTEFDLEFQPEDLTGREETTYIPQAYLFLGKVIYAGAGIGIGYFDGEFADEPNYYLRGGLDLEVLPGLFLDVSARYVVQDIDEVDDEVDDNVDTDTITLGANLRISI
jgi:hypothetical protein